MTFFEEVKRFFDPVFAIKNISIKAAFPAVFISVISISSIYILKYITNDIVSEDGEDLYFLFTIFITLILINYTLLIITRHWTHSIIWPRYRGYLYEKFINSYIELDNNEIEKI